MRAAAREDTRFRLESGQARALAEKFGTPLYVLDETHFRAQIQRYRNAAENAEPGARIAFASKANSTLALLAIAHSERCLIDVASEGELRAALAAGVNAPDCIFHGNNKQKDELEFALASGIGQIVIDNFGEIENLSSLLNTQHPTPNTQFLLRLAPGVDPITHHKISTGQADTKFGFNIADGSAERAFLRCQELDLPLAGFHCHVGSQLMDSEAQRAGAEQIALFAVDMKERHAFEASILNAGGGLAARYTDCDDPVDVKDFCREVIGSMRAVLDRTGLKPKFVLEPGRSLVAESGVSLYKIGDIKTVPIGKGKMRTYACVDGGLSDNPRPSLYGAQYSVERVSQSPITNRASQSTGNSIFTISGKHCETDTLFPDVSLPSDLAAGDLLQVLTTGAYASSMASNYNRYPRPASVLIRSDGSAELVQRRETFQEMLAREIVPDDLRG